MKLLVVSHSCVTPINQQLFAEVQRLTGWQLSMLMPSNWLTEFGKVASSERWEAFDAQILTAPVWKSGSVPLHGYRARVGRLLRETAPDAIYVHNEPYAVSTAQLYQANAATVRRPIGFYSAQNILKRYPVPFRWAEKWVFASSSFAFPVSRTVEQVMRSKGYAGASTVLPLGVDSSIYSRQPGTDEFAASLRSDPDEVLIGYLGRLVKEKGLATLLKGLAGVDPALRWRLIVVGSGPFEDEFRRLAGDLHLTRKISFIGFVPHAQAPRYLSAFNTLVLPSETQANWREQFGRVIVEALACGSPVIGSDSGEIPHLIRAIGGGMTFPEGNASALSRRLSRMIASARLRSAFADRGHPEVSAAFTNAALAAKFAAAVENGIRRSSHREHTELDAQTSWRDLQAEEVRAS